MATSCQFRGSEASTKAWFRTRGLIDKYLNILDLPGFRRENTKWSNYAKTKFNIEGRLFYEENNGTKAVPNKEMFEKIDRAKKDNGTYYNIQSTVQEPVVVAKSSDIEKQMTDLLKALGISTEVVDNITDAAGNKIHALAKIDIFKQVLQVVHGEISPQVISEEAAHVFFKLLPENHPLRKSAMERVTQTQMYAQIKQQYAEAYNHDEQKIREEAIGHLIAQEVVKLYNKTVETASTKSWIQKLFEAITSFLKNRFAHLPSSSFDDIMAPYKEIARKMVNKDIDELRTIDEVKGQYSHPDEFYFYNLSPEVKKHREALITAIKNPPVTIRSRRDENGKVIEEYVKTDGTVVKHRVTDYVKAMYRRVFGDEPATLETRIQAARGTYIHAIKQITMQMLIEGRTIAPNNRTVLNEIAEKARLQALEKGDVADIASKVGDALFELGNDKATHYSSLGVLVESTKQIYSTIQRNQERINKLTGDKEGKATIIPEAVVYDEAKDLAGTIDLLVVYSNGVIGRYEYKTIDFTGKGYISDLKVRGYEIQTSWYSRILVEAYGATDFAESVVIPTGVWNIRGTNRVLRVSEVLSEAEAKDKPYLEHIPIKSFTMDEDVNESLKKLYAQQDLLQAKLKVDPYGPQADTIKVKLRKIEDAIKKIALYNDFNYIVTMVNDISKDYSTRRKLGKGSPRAIDEEYLNDVLTELNVYKDILSNVLYRSKSIKLTAAEESKMNEAIGQIEGLLYAVNGSMIDLVNASTREGGDIRRPGKAISALGRIFKSLSEIDHPAFKKLNEIMRNVSTQAFNDTQKVVEEITKKREALKQWAEANGMSLMDAYRKLITIRTLPDGTREKQLITKYSAKYWQDLAKARREKRLQWMLANTKLETRNGRIYYNEATEKVFKDKRQKYIEMLESRYPGESGAQTRKLLLDKWDAKYNVTTHPDTAVFNPKNWLINPKESEEYLSDEWKYIRSNQPLMDFYNMLVKYNRQFAAMTSRDISITFIPNVVNDMISRIGQNGIASLGSMKMNILDSLAVQQTDTIRGNIDPDTGKPIAAIPLLYTTNIDPDSKSDDLATNLILFAKSAYSYKYLSETENLVKSIRAIISGPRYATNVVDNQGRPLRNESGKLLEMSGMPADDLALFDKFVNALWYGQNIQGDFTANVLGKEISLAKTIGFLQKFITFKALGLNIFNSLGNDLGEVGNAWMLASEGRYFNKGDIKSAIKDMTEGNADFVEAAERIFNPHTHNVIGEQVNKIAATSIERALTMDNALILMKEPGKILNRVVMMAMLNHYGVDADGNIDRLDKIRKTNPNAQSLRAMLIRDADGNITLKGVSEAEIMRFRHRIQKVINYTRGETAEHDIRAINTTIAGRLLMHFKNWIPGLYMSRFGDLRFDETLNDFDAGRMNITYHQIIDGGLKNAVAEVKNLLGEVITGGYLFGGINKMNMAIAEANYRKYMAEHPELSRESFTLEDYKELVRSKLKGAVTELRMILAFIALVLGAKAAIPDDEEDELLSSLSRSSYLLANRTSLEFLFFYSPKAMSQLITSPFTMYGLVTDVGNMASNFVSETYKALTGTEDPADRSPFGYYFVTRFIPGGSSVTKALDIYNSFRTK